MTGWCIRSEESGPEPPLPNNVHVVAEAALTELLGALGAGERGDR